MSISESSARSGAQSGAQSTTQRGLVATAACLVGCVLLAILSAMVIIPPWSMGAIAVSVGATEYSPILLMANVAWLAVALVALRGRNALRVVTAVVLISATVVTALPLARFHAVAKRAGEQLDRSSLIRYSLLDAFRSPLVENPVNERRVAYRAADGSPLAMLLYQGVQSGPRPTVVVIYGGAWRSGDPSSGEMVNRALASRGFTVAAIDYRHVPRAAFPAQLDDVRASLSMLRDSAVAWNVDTDRVALLGRSSGGHLAELAAFTRGDVAVRAVVAIYAPFDLVQGYRNLPTPDPIGVRAVLRDFLGGTPEQRLSVYREASPSTFIAAGLPPTLLIYGGSDHIVKPDFNRQAAAALRAAGVPLVQVEIPWAEHGFDMAPGGLGSQIALPALVSFLERHIGRGVR